MHAAADEGCEMDPETYGISVVPYFIDSKLQPHAVTVEQLLTDSAADLDFHLAHADQRVGSIEVYICFSQTIISLCLYWPGI